ncbi:MAG: hypothetical protein NTU45_06985 [Planctomycetota bacterium]|jgi:hypothetical protein|nr:hypothetical protein [Planctomycetota bacterium]
MSNFTAFCSDFYVNQKLGLKLDLPERRETVLDLFDRVRRAFPRLSTFQRYEGEVALESDSAEREWQWVALRQTTIRSGHVNPATLADSYNFHKALLEVAPYFLSISPLDIDMLEVVFGFDFETEHDRDSVVFDALLANTPLAHLVDGDFERVIEAQPALGISLGDRGDLQASFEVRTRPRVPVAGERGGDPISVFLTVRKFGPLASLDDLKGAFGAVVGHAEHLAETRVIPHLVVPIHEALQARG